MSSPPPRPSKFIEGSPSTRPDLLARTPTSNELFYTILSEMDEFESRRKHRGSQSSVESLPSSAGSPTNTSHPQYPISATISPRSGTEASTIDRGFTVKEGRRSINFTRGSFDTESEAGKRRESSSGEEIEESNTGDKLAKKFVGRLRALTGGRDKESRSERGP